MKGPYATAFRPSTSQTVAYTGTAGAIANAVGPFTTHVRVVVTTAAFITIGEAPVATTAHMFMVANVPEIIMIRPGEKVSAIQSAAGGNLHVTELTH